MSQILFLVRLRRDLRVRVGYPCVDRTSPFIMVSQRNVAEEYISSRFPIDCNPFNRDIERLWIDTENGIITFSNDDPWHSSWKREWFSFLDEIRESGVEVPQIVYSDDFLMWWNDVTSRMTEDERETFRIRLGLPSWSINPIVMSNVYTEEVFIAENEIRIGDMIIIPYAVPLETLNKLLMDWSLIPPQMVTTEGYFNENVNRWVSWWDETAPRMTDEQKMALWRLLDPQPYEIVEVPLETAR